MKPWTLLDTALTPDGKAVSLHEHDGSYAIRVDGLELMSTRQHGSEEKIAELACAHLAGKRRARILIGGLGFGFTLRATMAAVGPGASVTVAEIMAAVIAWNRNPSFSLAADAISDPRVTIREQDVAELIREGRAGFDSIILDVDNGPAALSTGGNRSLYDSAGLQAARAALRLGGCLAVWSAAPNPIFERRMERSGFRVEVHRSRARGNSGGWHTLFLGWVR